MILDKRDRSISVTGFQRVQKRSVLATFPAALDPKPEGQHRDAGQIRPEALKDLQEHPVAGGRHDGFVKPVVQIGEGEVIVGRDPVMFVAKLVQQFGDWQLSVADPPDSVTLDHQPHIVEVKELVRGNRFHHRAATGVKFQESFGGKPGQSLSDRGARDTRRSTGHRFLDVGTRRKLSLKDPGPKPGVGALTG